MEETTAAESDRRSDGELPPRPYALSPSPTPSSDSGWNIATPLIKVDAFVSHNMPRGESTVSLDATAAEAGLDTVGLNVTNVTEDVELDEQMGVTEMDEKMANDFYVAFKGDSASGMTMKPSEKAVSNLWMPPLKESKKVKSRMDTQVTGFSAKDDSSKEGFGNSRYLTKVMGVVLGTRLGAKFAPGKGDKAHELQSKISIQSDQKPGHRKQRGIRDREERTRKSEMKRRAKLLYLDTAATIHLRITGVHRLARCYARGFAMAGYFFFFVMVLITVSRYNAIYQVVSSIGSAYLPLVQNDMVEERAGIENWLGRQVNQVWLDPVCGNGVCESPFEFASFQEFGCRADCGIDRTIVEVVLVLQADFTLAPEFTTASEAMQSASWNLCQVVEERRKAGMDDLCWYDTVQRFERLKSSSILPFTVRSGEWYLQVRGDYFGLVGGLLLDASVASNLTAVPTEPAWNTCIASDDDDEEQEQAGSGRHHRRLLDEANEWMEAFTKGGDAPYQGLEAAYNGLESVPL